MTTAMLMVKISNSSYFSNSITDTLYFIDVQTSPLPPVQPRDLVSAAPRHTAETNGWKTSNEKQVAATIIFVLG